ncbi:MAG: OmpH family outer membrane protein [Phycisphaerae bacterium]|nr:OmpH family outer membrane protein [Phycisphaerae bacterium]
MKTSRICLVVIVAGLCGALLLKDSFAQPKASHQHPATSVAVCDVAKVLNNYQRTKRHVAELEEEKASFEAEDDKKIKAIQNLQAEMEDLKEGSKEYERRLYEIQRLTIEHEAWVKVRQGLLIRKRNRMMVQMYKQILEMTGRVAKERGIDIVLFLDDVEIPEGASTKMVAQLLPQRKVLYSTEKVNLTDTVLMRINEAYRSAGK